MSAETKAVVDAAEKSLDVVEETVEHIRPWKLNLNGTTKGQQIGILTGAVLLGLAGGGVGGYFFAKKQLSDKLRLKYEEIAEKEIADAKAHYDSLQVAREKPMSPEEILEKLHGEENMEDPNVVETMRSYQGVTVEEESITEGPPDAVTVAKNIFTERDRVAPAPVPKQESGWDYETELRIRAENPDRPYIISQDEFFEGEKDYEQTSLTYYEGDDTLVDDKDVAVPDSDGTVGDDNLMQFGHGSNDSSMLYVRNDRLELDFEVALHQGKYTVDVLGFEDEDALKHSYGRGGIRKFRGHDD